MATEPGPPVDCYGNKKPREAGLFVARSLTLRRRTRFVRSERCLAIVLEYGPRLAA
jgi:hypothetical protein